jgi:hypothetical protein
MTARVLRTIVCGTLLWSAGTPLRAQQPQAAVLPEAITVGDVFRAAIRVDLPAGAQLVAPDSLVLPPDLEPAARREARIDSADGRRRATIVYPLTAWRPGSYELPPLVFRIVGDGAERTHSVSFPSFTVQSVLPADTTGVEPRQAKDVLGANRLWWPILLALLVAVAVAAALWYWWRRRRRPAEAIVAEVVPRVHPRTAALEQLHALRSSDLLARGEVKLFHEKMTETLRRYAATLHPSWSTDLTTAELAQRMAVAGSAVDAVSLVGLLNAADLVKFARARTGTDDSLKALDAAVQWVERAEPAGAAPGTEDRRVA